MICAQGLLRLLWGGPEVGVLRGCFYHTFALYIVKVGMIAPHGVSLVNSDKLISRLNSDWNSQNQSDRIKRSRL